MLLEITRLSVPPEQADTFESVFHTAQRALSRCPGYLAHELQRHAEQPGHYVLLIEWQAARAAHDGRGWRTALQPFCLHAPDTDHYYLVAGRGVQTRPPPLRYPD